ncbi:MAG: GTPase [Phycisphaerales bacterium]|nr:GTPase [Phycisphaerales bacterium]
MGAAGRDFHDFNVYWKNRSDAEIVAFTATQIPDIDGRVYPPVLTGERYPSGIPIHDEKQLESLIRDHHIDVAVLAYSDLPYNTVMSLASRVNVAGAHFQLLSPHATMIRSNKPVIAVCAVRTGCGKSQTTRFVSGILKEMGKRIAVLRHPMPYGDLTKQVCQRYATLEDMDRHECTIEEREEYEPHIRAGNLLFAGIDYERILAEAEKEADVILWDGGNNDTPFVKPNLHICVTDPHRPGHESSYYPGEHNLRMADLVVVNKVGTAKPEAVSKVLANVKRLNSGAIVVQADSPVSVENPDAVKGKRVLVVEDGPTLTHGEMTFGAGHVAAKKYGAAEIIDPRPYAVGSIKSTFEKYNHLTEILPAMGYGEKQISELEATIRKVPCDLVLVGTPIDLASLIDIPQPSQRVRYDLSPRDEKVLPDAIARVV